MSYIILPDGAPDTLKFTLSVWFRVPGSSISAARAVNSGPLRQLVPVMTWGPKVEAPTWKQEITGAGSSEGENWIVTRDEDGGTTFTPYAPQPSYTIYKTTTSYVVDKTAEEVSPSHIGVACPSDDDPYLTVNLVMSKSNKASMSGGINYAIGLATELGKEGSYYGAVANCLAVDGPLGTTFGNSFVAGGSQLQEVLGSTPERFIIGFGDDTTQRKLKITPDKWHHLLLSVDFSNSVSVNGAFVTRSSFAVCDEAHPGTCLPGEGSSSQALGVINRACRAYVALDDVNITSDVFQSHIPDYYKRGPNDFITQSAIRVLGDFGASITDTDCIRYGRQGIGVLEIPIPTYSFTPSLMPFKKIGLPSLPDYVSFNRHIEQGALQIFTDSVINTGIKDNRRAYINEKGKPAKFSDAVDLMGKEPEVLLRSRGNWKKAKNVGSYNPTRNKGTAVGEIDSYTPDPNLYGKQGKPQ